MSITPNYDSRNISETDYQRQETAIFLIGYFSAIDPNPANYRAFALRNLAKIYPSTEPGILTDCINHAEIKLQLVKNYLQNATTEKQSIN